jgi:toxin ParE1/3/4
MTIIKHDRRTIELADHTHQRQPRSRPLEVAAKGHGQFPEPCGYRKEPVAMSIKDYRPSAFRPCGVIDRVVGSQVFIHLIVDGRRDMQSMLARRLLGA